MNNTPLTKRTLTKLYIASFVITLITLAVRFFRMKRKRVLLKEKFGSRKRKNKEKRYRQNGNFSLKISVF